MALNLKNPETEKLAKQLARTTGESITEAVTVAIKQRLHQQEKTHKREKRMKWLDEITRETAAIMNDGRTSTELFEDLYDPETGLPQ